MENIDRYLYRGISEEMHNRNEGLKPKGTSFYRGLRFDEGHHFDMGLTFDKSINNAVITHQFDSNKFPTSGVSTTPVFERAKFYATENKTRARGIIYKIDRFLLTSNDVKEYRVKNYTTFPKIPEDNEVVLVSNNNKDLPTEIVVEVISVEL